MRLTTLAPLLLAVAAAPAAAAPAPDPAPGADAAVHRALDAFHDAASRADADAYLGALAADGVFIGTAPGERWTRPEFAAFVEPYFSKGIGWTYVPRAGGRHVGVAADGSYAWFDEVLDSAKYGECRGSGVLRRAEGGWRIVQYELVIPIPNEIAEDVVREIRAFAAGAAAAADEDGDDD